MKENVYVQYTTTLLFHVLCLSGGGAFAALLSLLPLDDEDRIVGERFSSSSQDQGWTRAPESSRKAAVSEQPDKAKPSLIERH